MRGRTLASAVVSAVLAMGVGYAPAHEGSDNDHTMDNACVSFDGHYGAVEIRKDPEYASVIEVNGLLFRGTAGSGAAGSLEIDEGKLLFSKGGMEIVPSRPAASVNLEVVEGSRPVAIEAFDAEGRLLETVKTNLKETMNASVGLFHFSQSGFVISKVDLSSEGEGAGINFICALMEGK